jgi:pimeloyl-ACP methyl ester carboxylesterase
MDLPSARDLRIPPLYPILVIFLMAQLLKLSDGRYAEYLVSGAKDGFPLVWIHGTPGAYLAIPSLATACEKKGIKLITFSRAGYAGSSRNKGRRVVDGVKDIQELIKYLGVERCFVGGWSGGGKAPLCLGHRK